jgi:hypothetical protein
LQRWWCPSQSVLLTLLCRPVCVRACVPRHVTQVDCTLPNLHAVCHENHINAFPTITLFNQPAQTHEHYHGDRTPEALEAFAQEALDRVRGARATLVDSFAVSAARLLACAAPLCDWCRVRMRARTEYGGRRRDTGGDGGGAAALGSGRPVRAAARRPTRACAFACTPARVFDVPSRLHSAASFAGLMTSAFGAKKFERAMKFRASAGKPALVRACMRALAHPCGPPALSQFAFRVVTLLLLLLSVQLAAAGEGCYVSGSVEVNRVPGNLVFSVHSEGHSFDKVCAGRAASARCCCDACGGARTRRRH